MQRLSCEMKINLIILILFPEDKGIQTLQIKAPTTALHVPLKKVKKYF